MVATSEVIPRRLLLAVLASASPLLVSQRRRARQAAARLDRRTLDAVAEVVLPGEIGAAGRAAAVAAFDRWLVGYRAGAELLHGYGASEIRTTSPSPAPRFEADLARLDRQARERFGRSFADSGVEARRSLLGEQLAEVAAELPGAAAAGHVAVGLLSHWAESSAGYDAAYRARINRLSCRPLAANPNRPDRIGEARP